MYNPQRELLTASLNALNEQVDEIFLGDNSVNMPDFITTLLNLYPNTYYHSFNKNLGIAEELFTSKRKDLILCYSWIKIV